MTHCIEMSLGQSLPKVVSVGRWVNRFVGKKEQRERCVRIEGRCNGGSEKEGNHYSEASLHGIDMV